MQDDNKMQNPRQPIKGVDYDPHATDSEIEKQNTATENVTISPEKVQESRDEAAESAKRTIEKSGKTTVDQIDSKESGVGGKTIKEKIAFAGGIVPIAASNVGLRGSIRQAADPAVIVADVDQLDKMQHMAESGYVAIQSEILEEAVAGTDNSDEKIIGLPQDNNVYSEETTIMSETVTRRTKKYPVEHPRHRASGTVFHRKAFGLSVSGDSYDLETDSSGNIKALGTVYNKGWHQRENFLLNRLGSDGGYLANQFIMPKTGYFRLKGINPLKSGNSPLTKIGQVKRHNGSQYVLCDVYQARGNGIFEVEDLTPLVTDATHAVAETVELITANKGKMAYGQAEAVANLFAALANKVDDRGVYLYPELNIYRNRSSLGSVAGLANVDTALSCKNDLAQYVHFMHALSESEIFFLVQRLNVMNEKDNLKAFKGFEGMQDVYSNTDRSYWANIFKAKPTAANLAIPSMASYLASFNSTKRFNRAAALIYGLRDFWAKLEAQCEVIDNGDIHDAVMANVRVQRDAVEKLAAKLAIGTVVDPESSTSDASVFGSDVGTIILNFDPNDLFDYSNAGFTGNDFHTNVYPSAGYVNVFTGQGGYLAESSTYFVLPIWMDVLRRIINSQPLRDRLVGNDVTQRGCLINYFKTINTDNLYLPIKLDLVEPSWFSHYFLEGLREVKDVVLNVGNSQSAMFRYMSMLKEYNNDEVYESDTMSLADALAKLIDNPYLHVDPHARTIADFKKLPREAIINRFYEPAYIQLGIANNIDMTKLGLGARKSMLIFNPSRFGHYVSNLEGWSIYKPAASGNDPDEVYASNIQELLSQLAIDDTAVATGMHLWPSNFTTSGTNKYLSAIDSNGNKYQILLASTSNSKKDTPVIFKRRIDALAGATVQVGTPNADPQVLDFVDNPDVALYGHDGFQNLEPCDIFVLVRRVGSDINAISGGVTHKGAEAQLDDFMLCPCILCDNDGDIDNNDQLKANTPVKYIGFYSTLAGAVNKLYVTTATIDSSTGIVTGAEVKCRKRTADDTRTNDSIFIRLMRLPSLYGYERIIPGDVGFTEWITDANSNIVQTWVQTELMNLQGTNGKGSRDGICHSQMLAFYPDDFEWPNNDVGTYPFTAISSATIKAYLEERFGVKITDASDFKWYNHQNIALIGVTDIIIPIGMKKGIDAIATILAKPVMAGHLRKQTPLTAANIAADGDLIDDPIGTNARYAVVGEMDDINARQVFIDRFKREFGELLYWPVGDYILYQAGEYSSGGAKPQYVFLGDAYQEYNPDLLSALKYNDIRAYYTDKPAVRLNVGCFNMGMTECLLAKRYHELG